jgi:hypothetical protein
VEAWGCGRPIAEVENGLVGELRARREFMAPEEINLEARRISDPDWAVKDPGTATVVRGDEKPSEQSRGVCVPGGMGTDNRAPCRGPGFDAVGPQEHHFITPHNGRR